MSFRSILVVFLSIIYTVGLCGISSSKTHDYFLSLTTINLLISFIVLLIARKKKERNWLCFLAFCFWVGMTVEWIGVHTSLLFGHYHYGANLGSKLFEVPYMIGINWCLVTVSAASIANELLRKNVLTPFIAAIFMVLLDILMEPVAMKSDFWMWENGIIPFYNYVCWFFISLFLQYIYNYFKLNETNKVNNSLFILMTVFFIILNLF
jgi:putative membrane protein